jgi:hypothetical protein
MKRPPKGPSTTQICAHSEAQRPLNRENTCARWDSNRTPPLGKPATPPKRSPVRPSPKPVRPDPTPRVWTPCTPSFVSVLMHRPARCRSPSGRGKGCPVEAHHSARCSLAQAPPVSGSAQHGFPARPQKPSDSSIAVRLLAAAGAAKKQGRQAVDRVSIMSGSQSF